MAFFVNYGIFSIFSETPIMSFLLKEPFVEANANPNFVSKNLAGQHNHRAPGAISSLIFLFVVLGMESKFFCAILSLNFLAFE